MPITFLDGQINVLTLASDRPGGFSTAELGHVYEILGQLGRLYELHNMRRTAVTLLDTYLGRHAGERVLTGSIKRGDGENIEAVIWFCDLRESTPLAQSMSQEEFLGALNQFFDCMAGAVLAHGGQVLRFDSHKPLTYGKSGFENPFFLAMAPGVALCAPELRQAAASSGDT